MTQLQPLCAVPRKNGSGVREIRVPALEMMQSPGRLLYSFAIEGRLLSTVAAVSRVKRDDERSLQGYQRPEVLSHISEIQKYLESEDPMLPNAIVVAFDARVRFQPSRGRPVEDALARHGTLVIPSSPDMPDVDKPGWIVDGQQRVAAIGSADLESFPVFVNAFIARDDEDQREQFILVNATKPLPKGLIYELLPVTNVKLPSNLARRRFPAALLERLNFDEDSPFIGLIGTPTCPEGVVKDNSILRMLENSLSDGILYWFRDPTTGEGDPDAMLPVVKEFWWAIRDLFPSAWGESPRRSRLMHGAGIVSLGMLMDAIAEGYRREGMPTREVLGDEIEPLRDSCAWTSGHWEFRNGERRRWNEIQNTSKDVTLLSDHLLSEYRRSVALG
jgi:DGQHR domain-containing protein